MLQTVQEEMFANVTISKLKRAKALVMKKAFDATREQYSKLYNYQNELLRSNPGSAVVMNKEDDVEPSIFRRIYICLHACKRLLGWMGVSSKVQLMVNFFVLLGGMLITRCILLLGQLWTRKTMKIGIGFVICSLGMLVFKEERNGFSSQTSKRLVVVILLCCTN
jgi:hypothetical protein